MRYCYQLAERLHVDVDDVLDWPMPKLMGWVAYDEVGAMVQLTQGAFKNATPEVIMEIVRDEQRANGYSGIVKKGQKINE